jgi:Arc/MetJ-type ribon-helix-helix transcriptional regulator
MSEPARPIPVKLDVETLVALDALVAAGRQPTRSAAIRAGIEMLLDAEHRRALDLGLGRDAAVPEARAPRAAAGGASFRPPGRATGASARPAPARRGAETFSRGPGTPDAPDDGLRLVPATRTPAPEPAAAAEPEPAPPAEPVAERSPEPAPEPAAPPAPGLSVDW